MPLTTGGFAVARDDAGEVLELRGEGSFVGPTGGDATLEIRSRNEGTRLWLRDRAAGVKLRARSDLPPAGSPDSQMVSSSAFGRIGHQKVVVFWAVLDLA